MNYKTYNSNEDGIMHISEKGNTSDTYATTRTPSANELENIEVTGYATSGASYDLGDYIYRFPSNFDILRDIKIENKTKNNAKTFQYVQHFVTTFQSVLLKNRANIKHSSLLPPLKFHWLEDNSALIEWIFKDFRIGFSIEPDIEESGWYLVSNNNLEEISASGELDFKNLESLIVRLLNFALENS